MNDETQAIGVYPMGFEAHETYYVSEGRLCSNCSEPVNIYIPKGTTVATAYHYMFENQTLCPHCGCMLLYNTGEMWVT